MKFKLTSSQMNFYNKNFTLDSQIWNQGVMEVFPKVYSYEQLNNAYNKLVETHDSLRVKLVETENGVVADVKDHEYINYRFWQVETEEELMQKAQDFLNEPTDRYGLLVDCAVFQTPTTSGIMINAHHIVVDGFSAFVMSEHINGFLKDKHFAPVIQKYADYVEKEEKHKKSRRYAKSQEFWLKEFSNKPECNIFPTAENMLDFSSSEMNRAIPAELFSKIKCFCDKNEITPASFFNAVNAIYLYKRYDAENFTIGVPVFNRTTADELNTIGLYMHLVPLVIRIQNDSFINNAKRIEDSQMSLFRHQSFTQQDIKGLLSENDISVNQLFDVVSDFQEFTHNNEYEMRIPYGNTLSVPIEMHLQTFGEGKHNLKIRYRTTMFSEQEIQIMLNSIIALAENAIENPNQTICELEMVLADEKQKILNDFNSTAIDYAKDKCIHELFEEQVERAPEKVALVAVDKTVTYRQLNEEANRIAHSLMQKGIGKGDIVGLMLPRRSYLLSALFGILKTGAAYLPIDPDHPKDRIEYMLSNSKAKVCITENNINELLEKANTENPSITVNIEDICYCIYTSGSTGKPKGTLLTHRNVVNYVNRNEANVFGGIIKEEHKNILSVTTVGFDIFVTESLLPLCNGLTVFLANEEEAKIQTKLNSFVKEINVDIMQTTPTKMKSLIKDKSNLDYLKSMKVIILGGEALDTNLVKELKEITTAKIYNIYGPTETTVWSSLAEITNAEDIHIGKPISNTQIYILDKYINILPIGVVGELCIAGDGVCAGYLNNPELTNKKFIDNPFGEGKLYKTGDLAYWREDGNICYVGRNDFQVKIRGQRIELGEIENAISEADGVVQCAVVVRKDNEGRQLICAFYTGKEINAKELRSLLSSKLPKYMVPHIFTHIDNMPLTSSGKINRKELPEIDLNNISTETEYVAPTTQEEKVLTEAIKAVLECEGTSTLDNFFDLGGDSLKSIELISELENKGYSVEVKAIFEALNIQELAKHLKETATENETVEYGSIIPATAAQTRVYTAQILKPDSAHYNINYVFKAENINKEKLENALNKLISRHESLRTHFENINGVIHQVIDENVSIKAEEIFEDNLNDFVKPFDLTKSPLLRVGYNKDTVVIDLHHIIVDGESMPVFFRELNELYMGRELNALVQYGEFAVTDKYTEENEKYWLNIFEDELSDFNLPTDYPRGTTQSFKGTNRYELLEKALHNKIEEKCIEKGITPFVYYMACFNMLLSKYSGSEDICVGIPVSGRSSKYLNTIGMFANTVAMRNKPEGNKTVEEFFKEIKQNSIDAIDNQNYPFGELVRKLNTDTVGRNPLFDVMFAYQSENMTDITFGDKEVELLPLTTTAVKSDIGFYILPRKDDIVLMVEYCTDLYKEETINKFIASFKALLSICLDETKLIKDVSVLTEDEKNTVLYDFNNTPYTYNTPDNSTLYSLFEEQAEKNKEKVCIKANDEEITFKDFKAYAERIDSKVRSFTDNEKSVIAVICERSFEMYGAVYGIIRGGNAYLPIDPNYPQDRIDYILSNSKAKAVIAQDKFCHLAGNVPCIDATALLNSTEATEKTECLATPDDTAYVIYTSGSTGNPKGARIAHKSAINRILWMHDSYPLEENDVILQKTPYTFDVSVWELFWWGITGRTLCASKPDEHFLPAKILDEAEKNKVTHLHFVPSVFDLFLTYLENNPQEQDKFNSVKYVFLSGEALTANHISRFYNIYDYNKVQLHNLYGPTECAVDVSYYACVPTDTDPVPIGKPIYNTQLYVVDKYLNPTPIGVVGELCIGGINVGQGYLNNPELTNEKFIDNPFGEGKLYKTGDLAYWRPDGNICYVGRMDGQIKLNGQRIELGEIEKVMSEVAGIEAVAVIIKQNNGQDVLVAFCCGDENSTDEIIKHCENKLPQYMIPSKIKFIEKMPLNASGKLDRKTLKNIDIVFDNKIIKEPPVTDTEKMLCELFQKTLHIDFVGRNESFFALGGTSLDMISILSEDELKDVSAADFIANPTPKKLAKLINNNILSETEYLELLWSAPKSQKALVLFPFASGGAEAYAKLVQSIKNSTDDISIYFIRYLHSVEECEKAAKEIEKVLSHKKIYFYSHCVGSAVAMQVLNILEDENKNIVQHFISGGFIPSRKPMKKNIWNITPNRILKNILENAGAPLKNLSDNEFCAILQKFRRDTNFSTQYFLTASSKITCPISLVINKKDIFTTQYKKSNELWKKYALNLRRTHYINPTSHYFQSDNSDALAEILLETME